MAKGSDELPIALRLAQDPEGRELLLTGEEAKDAALLVKDEALAKQEAANAEALRENERLRALLAAREK